LPARTVGFLLGRAFLWPLMLAIFALAVCGTDVVDGFPRGFWKRCHTSLTIPDNRWSIFRNISTSSPDKSTPSGRMPIVPVCPDFLQPEDAVFFRQGEGQSAIAAGRLARGWKGAEWRREPSQRIPLWPEKGSHYADFRIRGVADAYNAGNCCWIASCATWRQVGHAASLNMSLLRED
jgi:hypothetical protein